MKTPRLHLGACVALLILAACAARPPVVVGPPAPGPAAETPQPAELKPAPVKPPEKPEARPAAAAPESGACPSKGEADCLLEVIQAEMGRLPEAKRTRLESFFSQTVAASKDAAFAARWSKKLGRVAPAAEAGPGYGEAEVRALVAKEGWSGYFSRARAAEAPFHMGRPEVMAAGLKLAPDAKTRQQIIDTMFELARTKQTRGGMGDNFEKGDFGHLLAEAAMQDCKLETFDRAVQLTAVPDNLRYGLWRARITGGAGKLAPRIRSEASSTDTTPLRNALEGLAPILAQGYCKG